MNIKAIAVDLDNTMLRSDETISDYSLAAMERIRATGVLLFVATGRSRMQADEFIRQLHPDGVAAFCGAFVEVGNRVLADGRISCENAIDLANALTERYGKVVGVEVDDVWHVNNPAYRDRAPVVGDFTGLPTGAIGRLSVMSDDYRVFAGFDFACYGAKMIYGTDAHIHCIYPANADKYHGVQMLCEHFGISPGDVAAFGDDYNDVNMLQQCGIGIAMGNAADVAKTAADEICGSNDSDGVVRWLLAKLELKF